MCVNYSAVKFGSEVNRVTVRSYESLNGKLDYSYISISTYLNAKLLLVCNHDSFIALRRKE
jgi:hypothetical protein